MPWQLRLHEVRERAKVVTDQNRRVDKATRRAAARAGLAPRQLPPARHRRLPLHGRQGGDRRRLRGDGGGGAPPPDGVLVRVVRGGGRGNFLPPAPLHPPRTDGPGRILGFVLRPGRPDVRADAGDQQGPEILRRPLQAAEGVRTGCRDDPVVVTTGRPSSGRGS